MFKDGGYLQGLEILKITKKEYLIDYEIQYVSRIVFFY